MSSMMLVLVGVEQEEVVEEGEVEVGWEGMEVEAFEGSCRVLELLRG